MKNKKLVGIWVRRKFGLKDPLFLMVVSEFRREKEKRQQKFSVAVIFSSKIYPTI
jgi:hypothetical protein